MSPPQFVTRWSGYPTARTGPLVCPHDLRNGDLMARDSCPPGATESGPAQGRPCLADITERLMAEFADRIDVATVSRAVLDCRNDLRDAPPAALLELIEQHARQCLNSTPANVCCRPTTPSERPPQPPSRRPEVGRHHPDRGTRHLADRTQPASAATPPG